MRRILAPLLAAAALTPAFSAPATAAPEAPDRALRVATYNIHHGAGVDGIVDLDRIAAELERGGADVIGLQEVDRHWGERSGFQDQATALAERVGMHLAYAPNLDLDPLEPGAPRRQYGTAVLSRFPILESRNTLLPRPAGGEQRGLLETVINVRGVRLRFATTHLQHTSTVERRAQTERIADLLGAAAEPTILVGDLNAAPSAPELAPLWPLFDDAAAGAGPTYPAEAPVSRIDYVLATSDVGATAAAVLASTASDHLQVTADLSVPGAVGSGQPPRFDLQAHRGGLGLVTESTLEAFANALELGVSTLELDVQITEDGEAVVTHDRRVATAKCRDTAPAFAGDPEFPYVGDYVRNLTLAQVRTLVCDKRLPDHPGQRVAADARMPLLREVFALAGCYAGAQVRFNVETKVEAGAPQETAPREQFVQIVAREVRDAGLLRRVTIQSFDWGALMRMREVEPRAADRRADERRLPAGRASRRVALARRHRRRRLRRQPRGGGRVVRRRCHLPRPRQPAERKGRRSGLRAVYDARDGRRRARGRDAGDPVDDRRSGHDGLPDGRRRRRPDHRLPRPRSCAHGRAGHVAPASRPAPRGRLRLSAAGTTEGAPRGALVRPWMRLRS